MSILIIDDCITSCVFVFLFGQDLYTCIFFFHLLVFIKWPGSKIRAHIHYPKKNSNTKRKIWNGSWAQPTKPTAPPIAAKPNRSTDRHASCKNVWTPTCHRSQHRDPHVVSPPPLQPSRDSTSETKSTVHRNPSNHTDVTPGTPSSVIFSDLLVTTWPNRTLATGIHRFLNHNHWKTTSNNCIEGLGDSVAKSHRPQELHITTSNSNHHESRWRRTGEASSSQKQNPMNGKLDRKRSGGPRNKAFSLFCVRF